MSLNYNRMLSKKDSSSSQWTSYSDLFMVLSVIFLLLYVVSALRSGSYSVSSNLELAQARERIKSLEEQLVSFDVLKERYLTSGASEREQATYEKILQQMTLLEQKAKREKQKALQQFKESESREQGLNQYQAIIKNIISANMIAQSQIKERDNIIAKRTAAIGKLKRVVQKKEGELSKNNNRIKRIKQRIAKSIERLKEANRSKSITKKKLNRKIARLRYQSQKAIGALEN
ncbi:hypothetical protein GOV10_00665, partial [Candidatus Woesearchaeota archaeon]|nr:hypothetical protein [Candidatus Woesearchaeota archaeon]